MRSSFQELFSRIMNTGPNGCLCSKKGIESLETHSCETDGHITGIFKMISSPNSNRKKNELEVRRPSDEENLSPLDNTHQTSNKKQSKLKNSVPNESGKTKKMKLAEEELPQKEHRKKREKMTNGERIPEHTRRPSPTRHRSSVSVDANCLRKNREGNKKQNGQVTQTHSHLVNNTQKPHLVTHTHEQRSHLSCPSLRKASSPSPDLPPKHPSHLTKLNLNHKHRENGIVSHREPSPLANGDTAADDTTTQASDDTPTVCIQRTPVAVRVDIRRAVLDVKKRSIPITPLVERIYSENRNKVETVRSRDCTTIYRQPCEFPRYFDNIFSYKQKRSQLVKLLQNRLMAQYKKEYLLCVEQELLQDEWETSKQATIESEKSTHSRIREQCDRCCPEMKRQRDQEKIAKTLGDSEQTEENSLERHESVAAIIPCMLTDRREKQIRFSSRNGYIGDITKFTESIKSTNIWTEEEKGIFKDKFYQCPKNFEFIAGCLANKSVSECIKYYYLNKMHVNFKQAVRGSNMKRRKNRLQPKDLYLYVKPRGTSITSPDQTVRQRRTPEVNWSPDEVEKLRTALLLHGRSWNKIQQAVGRSNIQCKMFYNDFASIEEYGLQQAIDERLRRKRQERLLNDTEDPLPALKLHEDISDVDSPSRQVAVSPCTTLTPLETTLHPLTDHSYTPQLPNRCPKPPSLPVSVSDSDSDSTRLTPLPPALLSRLMKSLMETYNCRHGSVRVRKPRGNSDSALLQPYNHRRLSATATRGCHKRAPHVSSAKSHLSQDRPSSDTSLDRPQREYPSVLTLPETKSPRVSSEVVAETESQERSERHEQRNSSEYDSDQEGGRLVIDIGADELIEGPSNQRGSFMSLPDLERTEDQEVFQSDDTSPSELSPDTLTDLSPPQPIPFRFQDAWAYRIPRGAFDWPVPETSDFQFDSDPERDSTYSGARCCLEDKLGGISLGERANIERCTRNPFSLMETEKQQRNVDVPAATKHNLPIEIQQTLDSLEHQPSLTHQYFSIDQNKRNGHAPTPKEQTHKRFKSDTCPMPNGTHMKDEHPEDNRLPDKNSLHLQQYLAQCRPDLYQQHLLPYPLYHHLAPLLLQNAYQQNKYLYPSAIPIPINKQNEPILVQNPMTSTMPPLLLQGTNLYPLRYPEAPNMPHETLRGHK